MNSVSIRVAANGVLEFDMRHQPPRVSEVMALLGFVIQHPDQLSRSPSPTLGEITICVRQDGDTVTGEVQANTSTDFELTGIGWWAIQEYHHLVLRSVVQQQAQAQHLEKQRLAFTQAIASGRVGKENGSR